MSKLIQIRQRIKAIETIKKVTHAMRLISMSAHSRLRNKQAALDNYRNHLRSLFSKVHPFAQGWKNPIMFPTESNRALFIVIGSQKGLCGTFNTALWTHVQKTINKDELAHISFVGVGKKATDFLTTNYPDQTIKTWNNFTQRTMLSIADQITTLIMHNKNPYAQVVLMSNEFKSFFAQKPRTINLIPFEQHKELIPAPKEGYLWQQDPFIILDALARQYMESHIQTALFESLLAEHAARFISMDNATRNAQSLLEHTKTDYNKLRQAKITKELTELTSSFSMQS